MQSLRLALASVALSLALASVALSLGLQEIDHSTFAGPERIVTQEAARYIYEWKDTVGRPLHAGISYLSRLSPSWRCWYSRNGSPL